MSFEKYINRQLELASPFAEGLFLELESEFKSYFITGNESDKEMIKNKISNALLDFHTKNRVKRVNKK